MNSATLLAIQLCFQIKREGGVECSGGGAGGGGWNVAGAGGREGARGECQLVKDVKMKL